MPLEDLVGPDKFVDALVREWPLGADVKYEGDDHLRGLKNTILNTFPNATEALASTNAQIDQAVDLVLNPPTPDPDPDPVDPLTLATSVLECTGDNPPVILKSVNIASVNRTGTGEFTVTFTVAYPDGNYPLTGTAQAAMFQVSNGEKQPAQVVVQTRDASGSTINGRQFSMVCFGPLVA